MSSKKPLSARTNTRIKHFGKLKEQLLSNSTDDIHKYSYLKSNYAVKDDTNYGYGATCSVLLAKKINVNNDDQTVNVKKDKVPENKWVILKRVRVALSNEENAYLDSIKTPNKKKILSYNIQLNEKDILLLKKENKGRRRCMRRELRALKKLHHENIVCMYEHFLDGPYHYISMEFAKGNTLLQYLNLYLTLDPSNGRNLSENISRKIFIQIIKAVSYMHKHGFIHRDIKPENILIKNDVYDHSCSEQIPKIMLCDFGFSTTYDVSGKKLLQESCGSLMYASPEITLGLKYVGPEIDIWSCGAILYIMFYLRFPFEIISQNEGEMISPETLISKYHMLMFPKEINISRNGISLIQHMLQFSPDKRMKLCEVFRHPWVTNVTLIRRTTVVEPSYIRPKSKSIFEMPQICCKTNGSRGFQIPETQSVPCLSHKGDYISSRLDSTRKMEKKAEKKRDLKIQELIKSYYNKHT